MKAVLFTNDGLVIVTKNVVDKKDTLLVETPFQVFSASYFDENDGKYKLLELMSKAQRIAIRKDKVEYGILFEDEEIDVHSLITEITNANGVNQVDLVGPEFAQLLALGSTFGLEEGKSGK